MGKKPVDLFPHSVIKTHAVIADFSLSIVLKRVFNESAPLRAHSQMSDLFIF
jgi:hypothetical protein